MSVKESLARIFRRSAQTADQAQTLVGAGTDLEANDRSSEEQELETFEQGNIVFKCKTATRPGWL